MPNIPPRSLEAANEIVARVPRTAWTQQDRDLAAALIAKHTGQEKALDVCRALIAAFRRAKKHLNSGILEADIEKIHEMAQHAMRS